jgi:Rho GTPase-activating protein 39
VAPFSTSVFGVTIDEVMELQAKKYPDYELPVVVVKLLESVINLNGLKSEGIFRVPGDTEQVYALRTQLDNGNYEVGPEINDPNTPASLVKLWMRELSEPLVPAEL